MSLATQIMDSMKDAMRAKDTLSLEALRAIKSEILIAQTASGSKEEISEADEIKILQKLVKMRKDSYEIFTAQNRADLAEKEASEIAVIEKFLPVQMTEDEVKSAVEAIVKELGAAGPQDLGKVMGVASKQLAGKADGKIIAAVAKNALTN